MANSPEHERLLELQDHIIGTENVAEFLQRLSIMAAAALSRATSSKVECGVTLKRRRRTSTVAGSSPKAVLLDEIEQRIGDGPCIEALRIKATVLLGNVNTDPRWPAYREALAAEGCQATLGVPLELGEDSAAALNFFAFSSGIFKDGTMQEAIRLQLQHWDLIAAADFGADYLNSATRFCELNQRAGVAPQWYVGCRQMFIAE